MCGYGVAVGCFTDVTLHSSDNYYQEHAAEPRWLRNDVKAAGRCNVTFPQNFQSIHVVICVQEKNGEVVTSLYVVQLQSVKLGVASYYCR